MYPEPETYCAPVPYFYCPLIFIESKVLWDSLFRVLLNPEGSLPWTGRLEVWRAELLAQAQVSVEDWDGATERLETFVEPFVASLIESTQRRHFMEYASGCCRTWNGGPARGSRTCMIRIASRCSSSSASRRGITRRC